MGPSDRDEESPATPLAPYESDSSDSRSSRSSSSLARQWSALRWQLSRAVFSRPIPLLTEKLGVKGGDLLVTLPLVLALLSRGLCGLHLHDVHSSGGAVAVAAFLAFVLAVRNNSLLLHLTGLSFERALFYHKLFGGVTWAAGAFHGLSFYLETDTERQHRHQRHEHHHQPMVARNVTGSLTFICLSALVVLAFEPIRRRYFDIFLRAHWILFSLVLILGMTHGASLLLFGFLPWFVDMVYRYRIRANQYQQQLECQVSVKLVAKDIVRVQFPRVRSAEGAAFHYEAGQYVFLCFPQVAKLEWHPFTIASAPHEPMVTICIKALGDWTKKLAKVVATVDPTKPMTMLMDGPYGSTSIEMDHYSHFVFVSGGIGVTPMMALANDLFYASTIAKSRRKFVEKASFVWSVRDREMIEALMLDESVAKMKEEGLQAKSWLPHALLSTNYTNSRERDAFFTDFYLTKGAQDLTHKVGQQFALCLKHGQRPDIGKILQEAGELARKNATGKPIRVAVLVCGPAAMISEVLRHSIRFTSEMKRVTFDVHQETFDF